MSRQKQASDVVDSRARRATRDLQCQPRGVLQLAGVTGFRLFV